MLLGAAPIACEPLAGDSTSDIDVALAAGRLGLPLPTGIDDARSRALLRLTEWMENVNLGPLLVYRLESANAATIRALAWQLGIDTLPSWTMATDLAAQRNAIANAIAVQTSRGTPGGIRMALVVLGFASAAVHDDVSVRRYDGSWNFNGRHTYDGGRPWPRFAVDLGSLDAAENAMTDGDVSAIIAAISQMQNMRSVLTEVSSEITLGAGTVVTTPALGYAAAAFAAAIASIGVGSGSAAPLVTDVALTTPFRRAPLSVTVLSAHQLQVNIWLSAADANGINIAEFGAFNSVGTLLARVVRGGVIAKRSPLALSATWIFNTVA
jgi:hypothetical protein